VAEDDADRARRLEAARRYRQKHAKQRAAYARRYREEHREQRTEYTRKYRAEHADEIAAYRRRWREQNLEQARAANRDHMRRKAAEARTAEERRIKKAAYARDRYHADVEASRAKARERNAQRRAADPDGYREQRRRQKQAWRDRNRDQINARLREKNRIDPTKKQTAAQRYYQRHAEERRAYSRRYHHEHREPQLIKQGRWRQRERRRIAVGLPVQRLHRLTPAERRENARAADAFFSRALTPKYRVRLEEELRTPPELIDAFHRETARIRATQYALRNPETGTHLINRHQAEEERMDAIARQINERLRVAPRTPRNPAPQLPPAPAPSVEGLSL
jgi:hypothetical protein